MTVSDDKIQRSKDPLLILRRGALSTRLMQKNCLRLPRLQPFLLWAAASFSRYFDLKHRARGLQQMFLTLPSQGIFMQIKQTLHFIASNFASDME